VEFDYKIEEQVIKIENLLIKHAWYDLGVDFYGQGHASYSLDFATANGLKTCN
jgi:hypothetical protein